MTNTSYKRYVLALVTLVYMFNSIDRHLMTLLLQSIKEDLHLSDTQLGFLTGIAFALFYATLGVPIARWADRGNRVTITSLAIGLWGVTVMMCVFVSNFIQLAMARVAAAVGEAGCMPPTYSLVGDYFPGSAERTRALTLYMLGGPLATFISFVAGGWVNELYSWRIAFFVMGIPALLLAILVRMTVAEPRLHASGMEAPRQSVPPMTNVLKALWKQHSSRHLIIAFILLLTKGAGLSSWYAVFLMRSHGMRTAELGLWLGLIFCVSGIVGILLGGYTTARWFTGNERGQMRLNAVLHLLLVPGFVSFLLLPQVHQALAALALLTVVGTFFFAPIFALLQRLVVDEMRATALAVVMLLANLIGFGIGPQIVGMLSDWLMPTLGNESLRYAMLTLSFVELWAAYHFWQVGRTVEADLLR